MKKYVYKQALNEKARKHIEHIYTNQFINRIKSFENLQGDLKGTTICYPYLQLDNVETIIMHLINQHKKDDAIQIIDTLYESLVAGAEVETNIYTKQFVEYFGEAQLTDDLECIKECNIDIIFDNLYINGDKFVVIDPEWVCDFAVPVKFIVWRMLNEWYSKYSFVNQVLPQNELYERYKITEDMCTVFRMWAIFFANCYVSSMDMDECARSTEKVDVNSILEFYHQRDKLYSSLYVDYGEGFSEKDKIVITSKLVDDKFEFKVQLDETKIVRAIRWDPVENKSCRCAVLECYIDDYETKTIAVNSELGNETLFLNTDPQIKIDVEPNQYKMLKMKGTFSYLNDDVLYQEIIGERQHKAVFLAENEVLHAENQRVLEENKTVVEQNKILAEQQQLLLEQNRAIADQKQNMFEEKCRVEEELQAIRNSRGWKVLTAMHKIRNLGKER